MSGRKDPIFKSLDTPLLFAHRGGAREQPESTERAFRYAAAIADVLELDVHVTYGDERFVIWHGPDLNNVLIQGFPTDIHQRNALKNDITEFSWDELYDKSWVERRDLVHNDVSVIQQNKDNQLLLLEQFLPLFPDAHLNIEIKDDSFRLNHVEPFVRLLDRYRENRTILVVSQSHSLIKRFREVCNETFPSGLSMSEVLMCIAKGKLPLVSSSHLGNRAMQSSYAEYLTSKQVIDEVHAAGAAVHVFLTRFGFIAPGIDERDGQPSREQITEILARGVDGIMTDRPGAVRPLM